MSPEGSRDPSRDPGLGERKGKKKRKVLERSCFRLPKRGERGEKAFSIDEYFFYSGFGDSRIVFSREKEFERNFRCKT